MHQQLIASIFAVALLSLAASTIALATRPREAYRGFWLMLGLWGILDGVIVWPALLQEPMTLADMRVVLGINLLLQCIYLPTGIIMATRAKPLVKGFAMASWCQRFRLALLMPSFICARAHSRNHR